MTEILCDRELVIQLVDAYRNLVYELDHTRWYVDSEAVDAWYTEIERLRELLGLDDD